jgi:hypothetical protein
VTQGELHAAASLGNGVSEDMGYVKDPHRSHATLKLVYNIRISRFRSHLGLGKAPMSLSAQSCSREEAPCVRTSRLVRSTLHPSGRSIDATLTGTVTRPDFRRFLAERFDRPLWPAISTLEGRQGSLSLQVKNARVDSPEHNLCVPEHNLLSRSGTPGQV